MSTDCIGTTVGERGSSNYAAYERCFRCRERTIVVGNEAGVVLGELSTVAICVCCIGDWVSVWSANIGGVSIGTIKDNAFWSNVVGVRTVEAVDEDVAVWSDLSAGCRSESGSVAVSCFNKVGETASCVVAVADNQAAGLGILRTQIRRIGGKRSCAAGESIECGAVLADIVAECAVSISGACTMSDAAVGAVDTITICTIGGEEWMVERICSCRTWQCAELVCTLCAGEETVVAVGSRGSV